MCCKVNQHQLTNKFQCSLNKISCPNHNLSQMLPFIAHRLEAEVVEDAAVDEDEDVSCSPLKLLTSTTFQH